VGIQKELENKDMRRDMITSIHMVTPVSIKFREKDKKEHKKMGTKIKQSHHAYI